MKKINFFAVMLLLATMFAGCRDRDITSICPECVTCVDCDTVIPPCEFKKAYTATKVWTHFMLWYEEPETTPSDGVYHWKPEYSPLTGKYASSDTLILEYQLLLMKYAGINGVIADWYGQESMRPTLEDLKALFNECRKTDMEMAVCYEDRNTFVSFPADTIYSIKRDMDTLQKYFFTSPAYSKIDGKPLLLIFGPKVPDVLEGKGLSADSVDLWNKCFVNLPAYPAVYPLEKQVGSLISGGVAKSFFFWLNNNELDGSDDFYTGGQFNSGDKNSNIFIAMPGFKKSGYRQTSYHNGDAFKNILQAVKSNQPKYLQIATWNNYEDGTMIEPAIGHNVNGGNPYIFLEKLQDFFGISDEHCNYYYIFPKIKKYYDLRVAHKDEPAGSMANTKLKMAYLYFCESRLDNAIKILDEIDPQ